MFPIGNNLTAKLIRELVSEKSFIEQLEALQNQEIRKLNKGAENDACIGKQVPYQ